MIYKKILLIFLLFQSCTPSLSELTKKVNINIDGCKNVVENIDQELKNEIFVVGHAYGKPGEGDFFPESLLKYFTKNLNSSNKQYLALTGDFVRVPSAESFERVKNYIDEKFSGYFIALGNHEVEFGKDNYNLFFDEEIFFNDFNNFLLVSANFSNSDWLPDQDQRNLINNIVKQSGKDIIIILSHQLFWLKEVKNEISPNSDALLKSQLNENSLFWLDEIDKKTLIVISGDYGVFGQSTYCKIVDNKIFIASGIGNYYEDSIIKISEFTESIYIEELYINK